MEDIGGEGLDAKSTRSNEGLANSMEPRSRRTEDCELDRATKNKLHDWALLRRHRRLVGTQTERLRARRGATRPSICRAPRPLSSVVNFSCRGRWRIRYLPPCVGMGYPNVEPNHKLIAGSKQPTFIGPGSWPHLSSSLPAPRLWLAAEQFTLACTGWKRASPSAHVLLGAARLVFGLVQSAENRFTAVARLAKQHPAEKDGEIQTAPRDQGTNKLV